MLRVERINDHSCIFFPTSKPIQGVPLMTPSALVNSAIVAEERKH